MKKALFLAAAAAAMLLLGACTSHFYASGGGRLVVKTGNGSSGRAITGSTDIQSATITIDDLTDGTPVTVVSQPFDWTLYETGYNLPVGRTYRIRLDVVPTAAAPGAATGVLRYGDEDVVTLSDNQYAFVFLNVRPSLTYAFHGRVSAGPTVHAWSGSAAVNSSMNTFYTPTNSDQFFYGPDGTLYYFSKGMNQVYRWTDYGKALANINADHKVLDGYSLGSYTLYAVTADSDLPGFFWAAAADTNGKIVVLELYADSEGASAAGTILATLGPLDPKISPLFAVSMSSLVPTGIAQDWVGGLYLSYYATGLGAGEAATLASGVLNLGLSSGDILNSYPPNQLVTDSSGGIVRDVTYQSGRVMAAVGPVISEFASLAGRGTADLWVLGPGLTPSGTIPSVLAHTFTGTVSGNQGNSLYRPMKFTGGYYKGTLYLEQTGDGGSTQTLSDLTKLDLDKGTATFIDQWNFPLP